jgi:hypothetical protein
MKCRARRPHLSFLRSKPGSEYKPNPPSGLSRFPSPIFLLSVANIRERANRIRQRARIVLFNVRGHHVESVCYTTYTLLMFNLLPFSSTNTAKIENCAQSSMEKSIEKSTYHSSKSSHPSSTASPPTPPPQTSSSTPSASLSVPSPSSHSTPRMPQG